MDKDKLSGLIDSPVENVIAAIQTTDLSEDFFPFLSEKAHKALSVKAEKQTFQDETDSYSLLILSATMRISMMDSMDNFEEKTQKAIQEIADDLNALADADLIHSCLSKPGKMQLNISDLSLPSAIYCFVLVPDSRKEQAFALVKNAHPETLLGNNYG